MELVNLIDIAGQMTRHLEAMGWGMRPGFTLQTGVHVVPVTASGRPDGVLMGVDSAVAGRQASARLVMPGDDTCATLVLTVARVNMPDGEAGNNLAQQILAAVRLEEAHHAVKRWMAGHD